MLQIFTFHSYMHFHLLKVAFGWMTNACGIMYMDICDNHLLSKLEINLSFILTSLKHSARSFNAGSESG